MKIKIDKFEGPLSLLLKLIEKEEMDITKVNLAQIADQFIDYIRASGRIDPEYTADFLVVASRLLYIKSKALLPYLFTEEEEENLEELERQLKMYKEFLKATEKVEAMLGKKKFMFVREFSRKAVLVGANMFSPPKDLNAQLLQDTFKDIIERVRPGDEKLEESRIEYRVNIEEKIIEIQQALVNKIKFSFNKLLESSQSKTEVVVNFLAMLELLKHRNINVEQEGLFSEILIEKYDE